MAPDNKLMVADLNSKGSNFEVGTVRPLFNVRPMTGPLGPNDTYDVSRDGRRFLVITTHEVNDSSPITLVVNWNAELKK